MSCAFSHVYFSTSIVHHLKVDEKIPPANKSCVISSLAREREIHDFISSPSGFAMDFWNMANDRFIAVYVSSSYPSSNAYYECEKDSKLDACWTPTNHRLTAEVEEKRWWQTIFLHGNAPHTGLTLIAVQTLCIATFSLMCHTLSIKILPSSPVLVPLLKRRYLPLEIFRRKETNIFTSINILFKWHEIKSFMAAALLRLSNDLIFN